MTFFLLDIRYAFIGDTMKRIILLSSLLLVLLLNVYKEPQIEAEEVRGVFVSYIELKENINGFTKEEAKKNIKKIISNTKKLKLNTIILQVRYQSDAIYKSKLFPVSECIGEELHFDILKYFLDEAHSNNIKIYAWINPYRIKTTSDINSINKDSPAYKYLNTDTIYINKGIYFNPAKDEVTDLIVDGVKEVLNYPVDGILFDDYFYPSDDIDKLEYEEYLKKNKELDLQTYHLQIINKMVEKVHKECQKKNIPFGISPDGNIDNNYNKNYADVKRWMKEDKYIDFIMPQIYYGFYNSTKGYAKTIKEWDNLLKNDINLYIALAFYKVGTIDEYALSGKEEWLQSSNIIMREIILSRNLNHYNGFSLFRYDNIFNEDNYTNNSLKEIENMKKIIE